MIRTRSQAFSPALPGLAHRLRLLTGEGPAAPFVRGAGWAVAWVRKQGPGQKEEWPGVRWRGAWPAVGAAM